MSELILKMTGIDKRFSGVHALKGVDFDLYAGEVHALMGENGAGKSTLMKVLCGIHAYDSGSIEYFGKKVKFASIAESQAAGISIIHQELNMMNHLTVAQNIYIGREPMKCGFIDDRKMEADAKELFKRIGVRIDPSVKLGSLTVGRQQMVEIAKAVSRDSKLLILDEPTAALTQPEVEDLFRIMHDLQRKNIGMIYISHRMDEINRISDRVTVMRDGEYVGTEYTKNLTKDDIVKMMVGRVIYGEQKEKSLVPDDAPVVLEARNIVSGKTLKNVSFKLRKGEILGFAGLMGAGRTELARAVYGADPFDSGEIFVNGKKTEIKTPEAAVKHGICYLSEDRKQFGLMLGKSVTENTVLASLDDYIRFGWINDAAAKAAAEEKNNQLRTKTPSMDQLLKNLSGGNQQKVIVARWLLKDCDVFIFDEPTRGIDIGAKSEMYDLMAELAAQGKSIIMISSELAEIQRLSDRVIVMCEGRITADLPIEGLTQEEIMKYATMRQPA
ncbi:MAG: sugar ABC transporter ATP-binding protein [Candidatus Borkfalkiaceae bacterium]|nr:sugar ABC transporter ATP-binding protein [Christensenellaceae bacterium]